MPMNFILFLSFDIYKYYLLNIFLHFPRPFISASHCAYFHIFLKFLAMGGCYGNLAQFYDPGLKSTGQFGCVHKYLLMKDTQFKLLIAIQMKEGCEL